MNKNFAGQNLNGRSFYGQDLRGADFSGCQLKSCDFTDADLTDAKFCRATLGVDGRRKLVKWVAAFVFGMGSGFLAWLLNYMFAYAVNEIYKYFTGTDVPVQENYTLLSIGSLYAASIWLSVIAALKYRDWRIVTGCLLVILIAGVGAGEVTGAGAVSAAGAVAGAVSAAAAVAAAGAGFVAVAGAGAGAGAVSAVVAAGAEVVARMLARATATVDIARTGLVMTVIYLLLGWYLNRRCLQSEEPMLALLRRYALGWRCWGGTQFSGTTLAHTDFSEADLTAARFAGAHFQQPNFTHAKNLHLTWAHATPLECKLVRTLLTEHEIDERDFSNLNLRGLSFKGLVLTGCNFCHADLSEADLSGCDLSGADLTEAMVFGTRFSNATMTGAIIDNWGMDKHTQLDDVVCDFVYSQRDRSERSPPQGNFEPGEFSILYWEIGSTLDFIAHSSDELQALLRAIDYIKQQSGDLVIQSLERKNESVVVRTQSFDTIDKAAIYAEVKEQMAEEMNLLQQEKQLLLQKVDLQAQHIDTFTQILSKAVEGPKIMNDHSRHYGNISAHSSAVNLGDHSTVSNHIEQVADAELKAALQTLQQLLANSHLPDIDKQQAHQAVDELAAVSQKPEIERKSLARRSLSFLKDLQQDLSSVAELGEQYGKLLLRIAAWF